LKEYQFQYTGTREAFLLALVCILSIFIPAFLGIFLFREFARELGWLFIILCVGAPILVYRIYKKRAVSNCVAKLNKDSVAFELKDGVSKSIKFGDLISYKIYY
jgi:hypothetical protein